jgi:formylmethanofuran dehydrogenase subunit C
MRVELELRSPGNLPVDLGTLCPTKILSLPPREIEKLIIHVAGEPYALGEHSKLTHSDGGVDELVLSGATVRIVSAGRRMDAGRMVIHGDAGPLTGVEMSGGELQVLGNAGDCLGAAMRGGLLQVHGNAGDWCGAALPGQVKGMVGGTILVEGNVGAETGAGMRRGLLVIGGNTGEYPGAGLLAGTIMCLGRLGAGAALEMKRGSLVAGSSGALLPGFRLAGEADTGWLRIYITWLRKVGFPCPKAWNDRSLARFTGDHLVSGKGEVLVYEFAE